MAKQRIIKLEAEQKKMDRKLAALGAKAERLTRTLQRLKRPLTDGERQELLTLVSLVNHHFPGLNRTD